MRTHYDPPAFPLCNGSKTFERLLDPVLAKVPGSFCLTVQVRHLPDWWSAVLVRSVSATGPSIIRYSGLLVSAFTMDQPRQCVPRYSCHEDREKRVPGDLLADGLLALTNVPLGLRV